MAYASKEYILWRLDSLIGYLKSFSISEGALLNAGLKELFDGDQAPYVEFNGLRYEGGKLIATVSVPEDDDADEWCACFQDYIGDRFVVEPYDARSDFQFSDVEGSVKLVGKYNAEVPMAFIQNIRKEIEDAFSEAFKPALDSIQQELAQSALKGLAANNGPSYRQFYQKRGSKGKRKPW